MIAVEVDLDRLTPCNPFRILPSKRVTHHEPFRRITSKDSIPSRLRSLAVRRLSKGLRPIFEGLEERVVLSTVTWVGPNGGDWDTASQLEPVRCPQLDRRRRDQALIPRDHRSRHESVGFRVQLDHELRCDPECGPGLAQDRAGTSTLGGPVSVATGTTLSVATGANLAVNSTLTDSGSLSFGSGDAVTFYGSQISVYGTMTATGDTFTNTGYTSTIQVYAGGELKASSSTFNLSQVAWAESSVLKAGDLTGDTFAGSGYSTSLSLPYGDVQYLGGNAAFGAIDILNDTLPSGGTLALNAIGGGSALQLCLPQRLHGGHRGDHQRRGWRERPGGGDADGQRVAELRLGRRGDLLRLADFRVRDDDGHGRHVHQHRLHLDHPGLRRRRAEGVQ